MQCASSMTTTLILSSYSGEGNAFLHVGSVADTGVMNATGYLALVIADFTAWSGCSSPTNAHFSSSFCSLSVWSTINPDNGDIIKITLLMFVVSSSKLGLGLLFNSIFVRSLSSSISDKKQKVLPFPAGAETTTSFPAKIFIYTSFWNSFSETPNVSSTLAMMSKCLSSMFINWKKCSCEELFRVETHPLKTKNYLVLAENPIDQTKAIKLKC